MEIVGSANNNLKIKKSNNALTKRENNTDVIIKCIKIKIYIISYKASINLIGSGYYI